MELPGRRELREQILHQMDGRTSYVSDADVYKRQHLSCVLLLPVCILHISLNLDIL